VVAIAVGLAHQCFEAIVFAFDKAIAHVRWQEGKEGQDSDRQARKAESACTNSAGPSLSTPAIQASRPAGASWQLALAYQRCKDSWCSHHQSKPLRADRGGRQNRSRLRVINGRRFGPGGPNTPSECGGFSRQSEGSPRKPGRGGRVLIGWSGALLIGRRR